MTRFLSPLKLFVTGLVLLGVAFGVLWLVPSGSYIFLPDRAHPLAPLVSVPGERRSKDGGGIYYVDVFVRKATLLERVFPSIREGSTVVPASSLRAPGESEEQLQRQELHEMRQSQSTAAAVALEALGYDKLVDLRGIAIGQVRAHMPAAAANVRPGDMLIGVDGKPALTVCTLQHRLAARPLGAPVVLDVRRGRSVRQVRVTPVLDPSTGRRLIGVVAQDSYSLRKLPLRVRFDLGGVGGPSAGLAFALELLEARGRDVDHGLRVAATGMIEPDGCVDQIGGVKQKTLGALHSHVDILLVPAGDNAREARRYAHGLRVVPVKSFRQAVQALTAMAPNA